MSVNRWIDIWNVIYTYNKILYFKVAKNSDLKYSNYRKNDNYVKWWRL